MNLNATTAIVLTGALSAMASITVVMDQMKLSVVCQFPLLILAQLECVLGNEAALSPAGCQASEWECGTGQCIPMSSRCDNRYDCQDGSDESDCGEF